ncbi:MAG: hypothetical protein E7404_00350 [Ruminococcaceae bacterium]|nr:hypothetical protein [Oscillospiraceae bacterium]
MFRNFLQRYAYRMSVFMQGRYGVDDLYKAMFALSIVFIVLSYFPHLRFFHFLFLLTIVLMYVRFFSRNIYKRQQENIAYLKLKNKVTSRFYLYKRMWNERKIKKYFKCKKCGAHWSVPKGVGKVEITCKNCKTKMIRKA